MYHHQSQNEPRWLKETDEALATSARSFASHVAFVVGDVAFRLLVESAVYGVLYGMSIEQLERVGSSVEIKASDIICRLMDCFGRFVLMVRCEVRDVTSNGSVPTPQLGTV